MRPLLSLVALFVCTFARAADEPPVVPLWDKGAPGFESRKDEKEVRDRQNASGEYRTTGIHNPYLTIFLPPKDKATGAAVVIAPGGGHRELWVKHEGENVAQWLAERGVAAFVLRYRLAREQGSPYKLADHAPQDGQRAVRLVRSRAKEWGIDPNRVGMMGFSAGGEVVAMVCRKAEKGNESVDDPVERQSAMPNFQALVYSGPLGIRGQAVTKENAPPTFIVVGDEDGAVNVLVEHYQALKKAGVSSELHVYAKTGHGFGLRPARATGKPSEAWPQRFYEFLETEGILKKG
ncbi:MAG: alpha/beta hydrolase [Gemmataceae bacterium]